MVLITLILPIVVGQLAASQRVPFGPEPGPVVLTELRQNDVCAIVRPISRRTDAGRPDVVSGLRRRFDIDSVEVIAGSMPTSGKTFEVVTRHMESRPSTLVRSGVRPDPNVQFLLLAKKPVDGKLLFAWPSRSWTVDDRPERFPVSAPNEVAGYLLVRCDAPSVFEGNDIAKAFVMTLLDGIDVGDEEAVRQSAIAMGNLSPRDEDWSSWFRSVCSPRIDVMARRAARPLDKVMLYALWDEYNLAAPRNSVDRLSAIVDIATSGRELDESERHLAEAMIIGIEGTTASEVIRASKVVKTPFLRNMVITATPVPRNDDEYQGVLAMVEDTDPAVVWITATHLAAWAGRKDLEPSAVAKGARIPDSVVRDLARGWKKVPFDKLRESETLLPKRMK